ncbi:MAG: LamG-like jellyroll fold domain-containing protein [Candidatus Paceibacterota bacterium]
MNRNIKTKLAFTLIELLVVIAIIGILSALIIIGMSSTTQKASVAKSQVFANSLRNSLMADMVSEWKLDGNTNDTWASSNANNGTWSGPTAPNAVATYGTAAECVSGQCMDFDGVDDVVDFGNNASLSMGTKDHTVSIWVKFDNASPPTEEETLIFCGGTVAATEGYWIRRQIGGTGIYFCFNDGSATRANGALSANGTLINNIWYNIVITMDRDSNAQAYINGQKQTGYVVSLSSWQTDIQNTYNFQIGGFGAVYTMAGKIDEVRIFNAITTLSQIQQNYFAGLNKLFTNKGVEPSEYQKEVTNLISNHAKN